jgi:hypothetical protein
MSTPRFDPAQATPAGLPWWVGAWRRRSISVPGRPATEPCDAWWLQTASTFIDIRVVRDGWSADGLPYSATRAFAGRFEIVGDQLRWHLEHDTAGPVPATDVGPAAGLYLDRHDHDLMIEDDPGAFREEWERVVTGDDIEVVHAAAVVAIRVGAVTAVVSTSRGATVGQLWQPDGRTVLDVSSPSA